MTTVEPQEDMRSLAQRYVEAGEFEALTADLTDLEVEALLTTWSFWRRPNQALPAGLWDVWALIAGRGFGKTRTGGEGVRELVEDGQAGRVALIAPTAGDCRDVMVEGESGLLSLYPDGERPKYEPSKRRITFHNGARATLFSGEEPNRLRGPQHDLVWIDEPASMPLGEETTDNARLGLRLGKHPRMIITGTPRPRPWLRDILDEPGTITTRGSTYENMANLADAFIRVILGKYEGTRLGQQELHAQFLDDVEGALWSMAAINAGRMLFDPTDPWGSLNTWLAKRGDAMIARRSSWRTVVAVDPPAETAECGIVVGTAPKNGVSGVDHAVIVDDMSIAGRPEQWGAQVVAAFRKHNAEAVFVEANQGGDMTRATIHAVDATVPVKKITASESKKARAEPIAALYERGMVHHSETLIDLEGQMTSWVPDESKSPDRLDAAVHCVRALLKQTNPSKAKAKSATHRRL